jgi:hypothetical protein
LNTDFKNGLPEGTGLKPIHPNHPVKTLRGLSNNMNFKYLPALLYLCVASISIGCSSPGPLYTQKFPAQVKIAMDRYEIRINDLRKNTGEKHRPMKYVIIADQHDQWYPPINDQLRNIVHKIIQEVKTPGDGKLIFEVNIKDGYKEFIGDSRGLMEKAHCEVITKMVNSDTNKVMKSGQGISREKREGFWIIVTEESIESMWLQTFEKAVIQSINNLQEL